jgi:hypothetical protein
MTLQENIYRIKEMMEIPDDLPRMDQLVNITGKVLDLDNLTDEEKKELQLKEKIVVDKVDNEYPIVLIQLQNGKVVMFNVDGSIKEPEENL